MNQFQDITQLRNENYALFKRCRNLARLRSIAPYYVEQLSHHGTLHSHAIDAIEQDERRAQLNDNLEDLMASLVASGQ